MAEPAYWTRWLEIPDADYIDAAQKHGIAPTLIQRWVGEPSADASQDAEVLQLRRDQRLTR